MRRMAWSAVLILAATALPARGAGGKSSSGLAYWSSGSGPAVVLLHGSNLDHRMWDDQVRVLEPEFRVIRYDLRAHGESALPEAPFSASRDLAELLDELNVERASLVGLSLGGQIAIDFALEFPDRVGRLVLASPGVSGFQPSEMPSFVQDLMGALQARDFERANEVLLETPLMWAPEGKRELVAEMVRGNVELWTVPPNLVQFPEPPSLERLEDLKAPTLVLVGDRDAGFMQQLARTVAERAPHARIEIVEGGHHLLNLSSPDEFQRRMLEFLRQR